ncbi:DUF5681 domain-containing protein [Sphingomonas sp. M1-B02]|uniref:DUF5681 domain-containing protein n=1 Tax=Sphingomonas sp. M1-B02 TaxID=3114300 RepID=UPI00223F1E4E|nr:DUF5681 domain-containing protein [Sphingomonas sp. S6-11]UZK67337.1 DUF5681 domain-containing protein [Sphingomonas sp. S6-11]
MPIRPKNPQTSATSPSIVPAIGPSISPRFRKRVITPARPPSPPQFQASDSPHASPNRPHHKVDRSTDNWDENGEYIVGKGRPPKRHQWKKGQSGNPEGPKPREKLDPDAEFSQLVLAPFTIRSNGAEVTTTLGAFALNLLKANAAKGNRTAQMDLLNLYIGRMAGASRDPASGETSAQEQEMIEAILDAAGFSSDPVFRASRGQNEEPEQ